MVATYKKLENDGFIITAFITKKVDKVEEKNCMAEEVRKIVGTVPIFLDPPVKKFRVDYDKEAEIQGRQACFGITILNAGRFS